jgi:L-threonylcarbamoyladenylate synthase
MQSFTSDIEECLKVLHAGGIILYPTDTIWGIGCDATNAAAVERIIELKQRPANKSFVVLVSSEREVMQHIAAVDLAVFDYLETIESPTTVIYENAIGLAENVLAVDGSVAMRICSDEFCKTLIKRFRKPIVSTSANISNHAAPKIFSEIDTRIIEGVDYVVKHRQDEITVASPSIIVKWNNGAPERLR